MAGGRFLVPQHEAPGHCLFGRGTVKAKAEHNPRFHLAKHPASKSSQRFTAVGANTSARNLLAAKLALKAGRFR